MRKSKQMVAFARGQRRNMTEAEKRLWWRIRGQQLGVKFRRQEPVGPYIADFLSYHPKLVIALDGGQHYNSAADLTRDQFLTARGFKVMRFWNNEIFANIDGVLETLLSAIAALPKPSPLGGGLGGGAS